uniref:Dynein assembly factor 3, axonemal homolog n=1 Tax=Megaselia scalaris TaxID=36166 RepID=T1H6U1_MEGSC
MFWGFSEALNFYEEFKDISSKNDPEELNILLFGNTDSRHIIKTLAKSYKHNVKVNFYVLDGCIEIVARNMLLLSIALDDPLQLTVKSKTHLFMDIFGNSLLRPISYNYMASRAGFLRKLITDSDFLPEKAPIFNIDGLKYRERDGLEDAFNFWLPSEKHVFNISKSGKIIGIGARFDYKKGGFDWDLQMCLKEYTYWRDTGVAFTFPEYEQCNPNKTLVLDYLSKDDYSHRGYVGDMVGPFAVLDSKLRTNKVGLHGDNDYRATDLTEANLFEMFYELSKELPLEDIDCHKYGNIILGMSELLSSKGEENIELKSYNEPFLKFPNIKINFLPLEDAFEIPKGEIYKSKFDFIFVASNYLDFVKAPILETLKDEGSIYFETKTFPMNGDFEFLETYSDFSKENN